MSQNTKNHKVDTPNSETSMITTRDSFTKSSNLTTRFSSASDREGKQLFPGGYFQYPMYFWPTYPDFMTNLNGVQAHRMQKRPTYNIYTEEDSRNSGDDADTTTSEEDESMEMKDMLHKFRIQPNNIDHISIEVPESYSYEDNDNWDGGISKEGKEFDPEEPQTKKRKIRREVGSINPPTLHSQTDFDQRRPFSRGRIDATADDQFENVPASISAQNSTTHHAPVIGNITASSDIATSSFSPGSTTTSSGIDDVSPITDTSMGSEMSNLNTQSNMSTISTTTPTYAESTVMSSAASSFTPSQAPDTNNVITESTISSGSIMINDQNQTMDNVNSTENDTQLTMPSISAVMDCQCGVQSISGGKVGSTLVSIMTSPWIVEIMSRSKHLCAGSLINDRYILTVASCVDMYEKKSLRVITGLQSRRPKAFGVSKVAIHPKYDPSTFSNNIALLRLSESNKPSPLIYPICLPLQQRNLNRQTAHLVTWLPVKKHAHGSGNDGRFNSRRRYLQLIQTEVELLNVSDCQTKVNESIEGVVISNGTICATPPPQKKCGGDLGGVLQAYAGKFSYEQIGAVSMSVGCRANDLPGIYTDIKNYLRWILFQTQDAHYCREPYNGSFSETD